MPGPPAPRPLHAGSGENEVVVAEAKTSPSRYRKRMTNFGARIRSTAKGGLKLMQLPFFERR